MKKAIRAIIGVLVFLAITIAFVFFFIANFKDKSAEVENDTKFSFENDVKNLLKALDEKKAEDTNFNLEDVNKNNITSLLELSDENYSTIFITQKNNESYIKIVGAGEFNGLTACGIYDNIKIVDSQSDECNDDLTPPLLTVLGNNPIDLQIGNSYVEFGAAAKDDVDGDLSSEIIIKNNINETILGNYNVTYTVSDASGNVSTIVRTVNVVDKIKPTVVFDINGSNSYLKDQSIAVNVNDNNEIKANSLKYLWSSSINKPDVASFKLSFKNGEKIMIPKVTGKYYLWILAKDQSDNEIIQRSNVFNLDNTTPIISFALNGNTTYTKTASTKVTVIDENSNINLNSLKYLWSTSTTTPSEISFSLPFVNESVIKAPLGLTGKYYLWVLAKDNAGNISILRTDNFNLDNIAPIISINGSSNVNIERGSIYNDLGATATDNVDNSVNVISTGSINPNITGTYTITYEAVDSSGNEANHVIRTVTVIDSNYVESKGVNKPKLVSGMTPIKWDESTWVDTTEDDTSWYSYDVTNKQWANARTADGSMWVWIPRFIYKIPVSSWHTSTTGTIDIQFTKGTDDNWNNAIIGNIDVRETAEASKGTWTNHPAFTFGSMELTGFWASKFEAAGTTTDIEFKPNLSALCNLSIGNMFTASRNMEINSRYGWETSSNGIDTHMMKNIEWGAVTYATYSTYGKNSEIWINPSGTYTTGCAGDSVSSPGTEGCTNTYDTPNGQQASTTGNIYGIYDMSGGAWEYVSAYIDNGNSNLNNNGNFILTADSKYRDVYAMTEGEPNNYELTINHKGDALYETSTSGSDKTSWNNDYSDMPRTFQPWFIRGGFNNGGSDSGSFLFYSYSGETGSGIGFRSVLLVDQGL